MKTGGMAFLLWCREQQTPISAVTFRPPSPAEPALSPHVDALRRTTMQTEFTCPTTGASLAFELQSDEASVAQLWMHSLHIQCPVCEGVHETEYRDVYVTGLMAQFRCIPADVKQARIH
jgi:hypothetical protein